MNNSLCTHGFHIWSWWKAFSCCCVSVDFLARCIHCHAQVTFQSGTCEMIRKRNWFSEKYLDERIVLQVFFNLSSSQRGVVCFLGLITLSPLLNLEVDRNSILLIMNQMIILTPRNTNCKKAKQHKYLPHLVFCAKQMSDDFVKTPITT